MKNRGKLLGVLVIITVVVFGLVYLGVSLTSNIGKTETQITLDDANKKLQKMYNKISVSTEKPIKGQVDLDPVEIGDSLPDIDKYSISVPNKTDDYVEIFSSPEKAGTGVDGWLNEVAKAFNDANIQVDGNTVSVKIRNIASGTATDFIRSGKYVPDGFTPSNELWGEMVKAHGIETTEITDRLVGNVTGVVISKQKHDALVEKYGELNVKTLTEAIINNDLTMGYTDPFASSTGLNFLLTALQSFDHEQLLSDTAVQQFESFQANVPFIASTTIQMREAAKSGMLDAFVLEYQTYINAADFKGGYEFVPFGARHDSPLYAVGNISEHKKAILRKFAEFTAQDKYQKLGNEYGFNGLKDYEAEIKITDGSLITAAQKVWKEKKNASKPVAAVFVADVSGSMNGEPLNQLKESLLKGQKYLGRDNSIGLVTYSSNVAINLPIGLYDTNQQSLFVGAVNSLQAGGDTATFDGIIVAMKMLQDEMTKNPDVKPLIFVLSDGNTNKGHSLKEIKSTVEVYGIPIYTIGYNADIEALGQISSINEAASINADTDDVVYKISNLLNVQM